MICPTSSQGCLEFNKINWFYIYNIFFKETLDKMQERIEMTPGNEENDPQMLKRMKENTGLGIQNK